MSLAITFRSTPAERLSTSWSGKKTRTKPKKQSRTGSARRSATWRRRGPRRGLRELGIEDGGSRIEDRFSIFYFLPSIFYLQSWSLDGGIMSIELYLIALLLALASL